MIPGWFGLIMFSAVAFFLQGCTCKPILYKPTVYPALPVLILKMPEPTITLKEIPGSSIIVNRGTTLSSGLRRVDNIIERIELFKGIDSTNYLGTHYYFTLFLNEEAAIKSYEFDKLVSSRSMPVFHEEKADKITYYFTFVNQLRSDPEGFCSPQPYFVSRFTVRLRNLVVDVEARDQTRSSDLLVSSVNYLASLLRNLDINDDQNQETK